MSNSLLVRNIQINIRRGDAVINLNKFPFQLAQLPFVRVIPQLQFNNTFTRVTEQYTLRINSNDSLVPDYTTESELLSLTNVLNGIRDAEMSYTHPVLLEVIPASGSITVDTFGYAARLYSYNIVLGEQETKYPILRGIPEITLELERGAFYNRRMYGMRKIEGGGYQIAENSTVFRRVPSHHFSGVGGNLNAFTDQRAILNTMIAISGTFHGSTPAYIITSNHPATALYDLQGSDAVSVPSASGGTILRCSIGASEADTKLFSASNDMYVGETSEVALFGAVRVEGSLRMRSRFIGQKKTSYSEWVSLHECTVTGVVVPYVTYLGTISVNPSYSSLTPAFNTGILECNVQRLTSSGRIDIDTIAVVPTDSNATTSIVRLDPTELGDVTNGFFINFNPVLGAYNGTGYGWNTNTATFTYTFATQTAQPHNVYLELGKERPQAGLAYRAALGDIGAYYKRHTRFGDSTRTDQNVHCLVLSTTPTASGFVGTAQTAFRPIVVEEYPYLRGLTEQST